MREELCGPGSAENWYVAKYKPNVESRKLVTDDSTGYLPLPIEKIDPPRSKANKEVSI